MVHPSGFSAAECKLDIDSSSTCWLC